MPEALMAQCGVAQRLRLAAREILLRQSVIIIAQKFKFAGIWRRFCLRAKRAKQLFGNGVFHCNRGFADKLI